MKSPLTRRAWMAQVSPPRVAPREELVNTLEFAVEAERVLPAEIFRTISGSDRAPFDRITLRPRLMVNCVDLDLSTELAGAPLFAPVIVGPVADQRRYHPEAERATVRGASLAKAAVVVSAASSLAAATLASEATSPLFYQVFAADDASRNAERARAAVEAGFRAVFVTVGSTADGRPTGRMEWAAVEAMRGAARVPVVVKGITSVDEATSALKAGAEAIVVSGYGRPAGPGRPASLDALPGVVDAIEGRVPVLVDGGFRRGTDIMKALAFGARAVLVGRPVMWGLAAYGADGVQAVVELLQTELGRVMGCCGTPNLAAIRRTHVRVHAPSGSSPSQA